MAAALTWPWNSTSPSHKDNSFRPIPVSMDIAGGSWEGEAEIKACWENPLLQRRNRVRLHLSCLLSFSLFSSLDHGGMHIKGKYINQVYVLYQKLPLWLCWTILNNSLISVLQILWLLLFGYLARFLSFFLSFASEMQWKGVLSFSVSIR